MNKKIPEGKERKKNLNQNKTKQINKQKILIAQPASYFCNLEKIILSHKSLTKWCFSYVYTTC